MKKEAMIGIISFLILAIGLSGCIGMGPEVTEYFNEIYSADDTTILEVSNINGQIEISTWENESIKFDAIKRSRYGVDELDKVEINVNQEDNNIEIITKYTGIGNVQATVDMNIKIPNNVTLETATTSNGAVQITNAKGNFTASSSNGGIYLDNADGYVRASTSNGKIEVKDCKGIRDLKTSNGQIYVEISDFKEDIDIETSNGQIIAYINPLLNANIEIETSNGDIDITGLKMNLTTVEGKYIAGTLGIGGKYISIKTSNGDIDLYKIED